MTPVTIEKPEAPAAFVGNDRLLFGMILGVLAFWLFAQTTLNTSRSTGTRRPLPQSWRRVRDGYRTQVALHYRHAFCAAVTWRMRCVECAGAWRSG